MQVTLNTSVREVIETNKEALEIFDKHGVCVEYECPDTILDFEIADCESMCHIDDVDALVEELNQFFSTRN